MFSFEEEEEECNTFKHLNVLKYIKINQDTHTKNCYSARKTHNMILLPFLVSNFLNYLYISAQNITKLKGLYDEGKQEK